MPNEDHAQVIRVQLDRRRAAAISIEILGEALALLLMWSKRNEIYVDIYLSSFFCHLFCFIDPTTCYKFHI